MKGASAFAQSADCELLPKRGNLGLGPASSGL
jgi:hypothetical protein